MEGSAEDLGAPESWEVADLDESMNRLNLLLSSSTNKHSNNPNREPANDDDDDGPPPQLPQSSSSSSAPSGSSSCSSSSSSSGEKVSDDVINQVDQFLREAIQNPRERLSGKLFFLPSFLPLYIYIYI